MAKVGHLVKESMVKEVSAELADTHNLFVVRVKQLSPQDATVFRKKLFASKASLHVVKRRLARKLFEGIGTERLPELADGKSSSVGLVMVRDGDASAVAKDVMKFIKDHQDQVSVSGGLLEGRVVDSKAVQAFAELPPRETLLAQVILTVEAPINDVCTTVERLIGDVCWALEQAAAKKPV